MALPLKVTPIGGVGEIGNNCFLYESGDEAFIIDCGINPNEDLSREEMLTKFSILSDKNVRAILLTHAHLDHAAIGMALAEKLGVPLYVSKIGKLFIEKNNRRFYSRQIKTNVQINLFFDNSTFNIGNAKITPIKMEHSIPESFGFVIDWNNKKAFHLGDCKLTGFNFETREVTLERLKKVGQIGIDLLVMDILNIRYPGFTDPEKEVTENILKLISQEPGKKHFIFLFASNLCRISAIWADVWRKAQVHFRGASMQTASQLLDIISGQRMRHYSATLPSKTSVYFCTGCQGEEGSFISRLANNDVTEMDKIKAGDSVYISATFIPSADPVLHRLKKTMFHRFLKVLNEKGAKIFVHTGQGKIYGDFVIEEDIHVSGHEGFDGLSAIVESVKPQWLMPYHVPHNNRYASKAVKLTKEVSQKIEQEIFLIDAKNGTTITI